MIIVGMIALPISYDLYESDIGMSSLLMGDILIIFSGLLYAIDVNICKYVSDKIDAKEITSNFYHLEFLNNLLNHSADRTSG